MIFLKKYKEDLPNKTEKKNKIYSNFYFCLTNILLYF